MRIASACAVAAAAILLTACSRAPRQLRFTVEPAALPADGFSRARLIAGAPGASFRIREGRRHARIEGEALVAGVTPGRVVVEAAAPGFMPASARIATEAVYTDAAGDGTPDFLRLDTPRDRAAFRRWFTFLAEAAFLAGPARRPAEITDCAGLVRFAYREALREHDGDWAMSLRLPLPSDAPALMKYRYPYTPLGAGLFRVASGPFVPRDLTGGAFAEFADARTLLLRNTHPVSRDPGRASPGDLLFFRQLAQNQPFHVMIYLGASQFDDGREAFIVYHTGRIGRAPGEIRRPALAELLRHPLPRWRPHPGNSNFLGVFRWNILRGDA